MIELFDCGVYFGSSPQHDIDASPEDLLAAMDRNGVKRAMVTHTECLLHLARNGNPTAFGAAHRYADRLVALPAVSPFYHLPDWTNLADLRAQGARMAAMFPVYQRWNVDRISVRKMVAEMQDLNLGIVAVIGTHGEPSALVDAIGPTRTPLVIRCIQGGGYCLMDEFYHIGRDFPNAYFDLGTVCGLGAIEYLVEKLGAHRFVLGSNYPLATIEAPRLMLETALLSDGEKDQIAFRNMEGILEVCRGS